MAAPAYSYAPAQSAAPQRERAVRPESRPSVRVVPGSRRAPKQQRLAQDSYKKAAAIVLVALLVATLGIVRVCFCAGATVMTNSTAQITSNVSELRSYSNNLEVAATRLSNPNRIKAEAGKLGMVDPYASATITLGQDVVAVAEDGSLSLSESLARATGSSKK